MTAPKTFDRPKYSRYTVDNQPALQIRLNRDVGPLPAGLSLELPRDTAVALLSRKDVATPVGSFSAYADMVLSRDDLDEIGFDLIAAND